MMTRTPIQAWKYGLPWMVGQPDDDERLEAGHRLADLLRPYRSRRTVVLAIPPGGVTVASEIARTLRLPLDVMVTREFVLPHYPALAAGALSEGGGLCFNAALLRLPGIVPQKFWDSTQRVRVEVGQLVALYRRSRPPPLLSRQVVILVDDGLGSGLAQLAAIQALRYAHVQRCIVATPRGTVEAIDRVGRRADLLLPLATLPTDNKASYPSWRYSPGDDDAAALFEYLRLHRVVESDE